MILITPLSISLTNWRRLDQTGRWRETYSALVGRYMVEGGGEEPQATWKNRKIEMNPSKHSMLRERVKAQGKGGATAGECAIDREFMLM